MGSGTRAEIPAPSHGRVSAAPACRPSCRCPTGTAIARSVPRPRRRRRSAAEDRAMVIPSVVIRACSSGTRFRPPPDACRPERDKRRRRWPPPVPVPAGAGRLRRGCRRCQSGRRRPAGPYGPDRTPRSLGVSCACRSRSGRSPRWCGRWQMHRTRSRSWRCSSCSPGSSGTVCKCAAWRGGMIDVDPAIAAAPSSCHLADWPGRRGGAALGRQHPPATAATCRVAECMPHPVQVGLRLAPAHGQQHRLDPLPRLLGRIRRVMPVLAGDPGHRASARSSGGPIPREMSATPTADHGFFGATSRASTTAVPVQQAMLERALGRDRRPASGPLRSDRAAARYPVKRMDLAVSHLLHGLEIRDQVLSFVIFLDAGKDHLVAGDSFLGIC